MTAEALLILSGIGYIVFRQWLRHDKRRILHRERLAAIEKGIELPVAEHEESRVEWSVQRFLLLAGLSWIAIGVGGGITLHFVLLYASPEWQRQLPPPGSEIGAIIPIGIGFAHLITYLVGERKNSR